MANSGVVSSELGGETSAASNPVARRKTRRRWATGLGIEGPNRGIRLLSRKEEVVSDEQLSARHKKQRQFVGHTFVWHVSALYTVCILLGMCVNILTSSVKAEFLLPIAEDCVLLSAGMKAPQVDYHHPYVCLPVVPRSILDGFGGNIICIKLNYRKPNAVTVVNRNEASDITY